MFFTLRTGYTRPGCADKLPLAFHLKFSLNTGTFRQVKSAPAIHLMRTTLLLCLLLTCLISVTPAQSERIVFMDDFSSNTQGWWLGDIESGTNAIRNGRLYMRHKRDGQSWAPLITIPDVDIQQDFSVEARFHKLSGEAGNSYGISWGGSDKNRRFDFIISSNGYFSVGTVDGPGDRVKLKDWTKSSTIAEGDGGANTLRIEYRSGNHRFLINGTLVYEQRLAPLFGQQFGFVIYRDVEIEAEYLRISAPGGLDAVTTFFDDFNDNSSGWWTGDIESGENAIRGGKLYMNHKRSSQSWAPMVTVDAVNLSRDFRVETRITKRSGTENNGYGLTWAADGKTQRYDFIVSGNGYFSVGHIQGSGDRAYLIKWTTSDAIKQGNGGVNTLQVVREGDLHRFIINGTEVGQYRLTTLYGQDFGFAIYNNIAVEVDYLRIDELRPHAANQPPLITITEPDLRRGFNVVPVQTLRVAGRAIDSDGIQSVTVNGIMANLQGGSNFSTEIPVQIGDNTITVVATDRRGAQAQERFSVRRQVPMPNQSQERRLALVVGNSSYTFGGSLRNPVNDASAMQRALESLGFTVLRYENCSQAALRRAIDEFGRQLTNYDMGLFFYAGHGIQVKGRNYLVPVDAQLEVENDVEYDCVLADRVLAKMEAAGTRTNLVILDACRDNPFERSWNRSAGGEGLAFMNAPRGSLIAYATAPGSTASDGSGTNGLYTAALLEHINTPDLTVEQVFKRVRGTVVERSGGKQTPWESTSLTGDFFFKQ